MQYLQRWGVAALSLLVALVTWVSLSVFQPAWVKTSQELSTDLAWRLLSKSQDERRVILVDIDERSLQDIGPWPWPRSTQAKLLDQLAEQGAALQVLDVVFTASQTGDEVLAQAFKQHQLVLAQAFALPQQGGQTQAGQLAGALDWPSCPAPFSEATGYLANSAGLQSARAGHITPRLSQDGVVRQQPAVLCFQDKAYPALGLAAGVAAGRAAGVDVASLGHIAAICPFSLHLKHVFSDMGVLGPLAGVLLGDPAAAWTHFPVLAATAPGAEDLLAPGAAAA